MHKIFGLPRDVRASDRLLSIDGMPVGHPDGLLVEFTVSERDGLAVTVWGATQMFEMWLASDVKVEIQREALTPADAMAITRARLHKIAVEEADDEVCDECRVRRGHEEGCPNLPGLD